MSIESADLEGIREAGRVTTGVLDVLESSLRDGVTTGELDAIAGEVLLQNDAQSAPPLVYGFPGTVLTASTTKSSTAFRGAAGSTGRLTPCKAPTAGPCARATAVWPRTANIRSSSRAASPSSSPPESWENPAMKSTIAFAIGALSLATVTAQTPNILTFEHKVQVKSTVPALAGSTVDLYVRERVSASLKRDAVAADRVVLFVHGAGTPAEVAFDVPHSDYSWMAYLAGAGFDAFSMDTTGYGRSVRPAEMNDPCNLAAEQQKQFVPSLIAAPCDPTYPGQLTNIGSDWNDIDAVVEYIRKLRRVEKVSMVAWSLGGPRAGGYAAQHPGKVHRLVLLSPAYTRTAPAEAPPLPNKGVVFNTQNRGEFDANWDRQLGCPNQYDPAVREVVWSEMIKSDPVGAKWGTGVRRAPSTTTWGWNNQMLAGMKTPTLMVAAALDKQVPPERVKAAYDDLGAADKVLLDLGCASHNAMWESNHLDLFAASRDWLMKGEVGGVKHGVVRIGYPKS